MTLYLPPLYARIPVYSEDGLHVANIVTPRPLRPGEALEPMPGYGFDRKGDAGLVDAIRLAKQASENIRYD